MYVKLEYVLLSDSQNMFCPRIPPLRSKPLLIQAALKQRYLDLEPS